MNQEYKRIITTFEKICLPLDDGENIYNNLCTSFDKDVLSFFYVLGGADKKFSERELFYVNSTLGKTLTPDFFKNKENLNWGIKRNKFSYSYNFCLLNLSNLSSSDNYSIVLFAYDLILNFYKNFGLEYLSCDEKTSDKELKWYTDYISRLTFDINYYQKQIREEFVSIVEQNIEENADFNEALKELDELIGLDPVKLEIKMLINLINIRKIREQRGLANPVMSYHMVFSGNPGTGKTTVARILSRIFKGLGLLSAGTLTETDRSGLVAGYIGQTAEKTINVCKEALGGVLFIDEAYALNNSSSNDYGLEAINTLLKYMEDNRNDLIVIVAGYTELMKDFINSNPGLKSRFNKYIEFADYSNAELIKIVDTMAKKSNYKISKKAKEAIISNLEALTPKELADFGNARGIRNVFENAVTNQASRLANCKSISDTKLITISDKDIVF